MQTLNVAFDKLLKATGDEADFALVAFRSALIECLSDYEFRYDARRKLVNLVVNTLALVNWRSLSLEQYVTFHNLVLSLMATVRPSAEFIHRWESLLKRAGFPPVLEATKCPKPKNTPASSPSTPKPPEGILPPETDHTTSPPVTTKEKSSPGASGSRLLGL